MADETLADAPPPIDPGHVAQVVTTHNTVAAIVALYGGLLSTQAAAHERAIGMWRLAHASANVGMKAATKKYEAEVKVREDFDKRLTESGERILELEERVRELTRCQENLKARVDERDREIAALRKRHT